MELAKDPDAPLGLRLLHKIGDSVILRLKQTCIGTS